MPSQEQSSILSRSQTDDDIVEIEGRILSLSFLFFRHIEMSLVSRSCTCQCHQLSCNASASNPTSEYLLFEQALRQTRQDQQQERSLDNNHLVQTLKRQHQELLTLYHRQIHVNKTDREQQTIRISQHDSQIQTDMPSSSSVQSRPVSNLQVSIKQGMDNSIGLILFHSCSKAMEHIQHRISKVPQLQMHVLSIVFSLQFEPQVLRYNN